MVLGKFPMPGRPTILMKVRANLLAVNAVGFVWTFLLVKPLKGG